MIIKRNNLKPQHSTSQGDEHSQFSGHLPEEDAWDQLAYEAGNVQDRRRDDRRRAYRRTEEKNLISNAYEEANAIRENAHQEGFEEGLRQAELALAELRDTLSALLSGRDEALLSIADEIAPLSIEVAERIIKTEVSCDETLVLALVKDTIQRAGRNAKSMIIKVNAMDVRVVKQDLKENPIPNSNAEMIVLEDPLVDPGSCIVETNSGLIDASFTTQLQLLRALFGLKGGG